MAHDPELGESWQDMMARERSAATTHAADCRVHDANPPWYCTCGRGVIFDTQRQALWLLLGGGLDNAGKWKWLDGRLDAGMTIEAIFVSALREMDGMVAT